MEKYNDFCLLNSTTVQEKCIKLKKKLKDQRAFLHLHTLYFYYRDYYLIKKLKHLH
jgi:hypothetical protein